MHTFLAIVRYEFFMAIRRWGVWLAFAAAGMAVALTWDGTPVDMPGVTPQQWSVLIALIGNTLVPVVVGIVTADRLVRDRKSGVRELLFSTALSRRVYVTAKYVGVMLAAVLPALLAVLATGVVFVADGLPVGVLPRTLLPFLAINLPAYLFVGAFSLAGPEVLPLRVYQILFTGYWFWGNFVSQELMPTLNGTLLTVKGDFVASGLFRLGEPMITQTHTSAEAWLNLAILSACTAGALVGVERYLAWQARKA